MRKTRTVTLYIAFLLCAVPMMPHMPGRAHADGEADTGTPPAQPASDERAALGLATFAAAFKAKGLKGRERLSARGLALEKLAEIQHPDVVDVLAKHTRNRDPDLRTAAVLYLGKQQAFPGYAGQAVLAAVKKNRKDATFLLAGIDSIQRLRYLGAWEWLIQLIRLSDYSLARTAVVTAAKLNDARLTEHLIRLLKTLRVEKGVKWDGYHATWATGAQGDVTREEAERIRDAGEAAARDAKAKHKGRRRSMRDMGAFVLESLQAITGQKFSGSVAARAWLRTNAAQLEEDIKTVQRRDEAQQRAAKALKSRRRRK